MFHQKVFAVDDTADAIEMARAVAFGHLVAHADDGLVSTPMPFVIDDDRTVRGHLAKANPILEVLPCQALLIVGGPDAYVSPSWYPSKREHERVVPTWNYEVVHVHGELRAHDTAWTEQLVRDLTDHHERTMPTPWSVDDAPDDFVERQLRAIVGVSLRADRVVGKRKLSQNRPVADARGAADGLTTRGDGDVAAGVRRHHPEIGQTGEDGS